VDYAKGMLCHQCPVLFILTLESVIRKVPRTEDLTLKDGNIILAYADDIVIIGKTQEEVKKSMMEMMKAGENIGLGINTEKTKYMTMTITIKIGTLRDITIGNSQIEQIKDFKYLGATISVNSV